MLKTILTILILIALKSICVFAQVNTETFRQDAEAGFSGNVNLEAVALTGNTDFQLISLGSRLNYNWGNDYSFLVAESSYGWEDKKAFSDQALAHLRHVITTGELLQVEVFTQFDYNKKRLLLARKLIGGGLRFRLIKSEAFKLRLGIAYMLENENYDLPSGSEHEKGLTVHRLSSYATFTVDLQKNLSLISITYYQPRLDEWNDNKVMSENSLVVDLGSLVDLYLKFNLRYDSLPPDTVKKLDTASKFGLSFKF